MDEFSIDYGDLTLAMGTTAYKDLKKEHDALCEWVNQLSELTHGYREVSEKEIFEVIEDYQNSAHKLKEERDELKRLLKLCVKDLYSPSGKFKKGTALEVMKYINQPSEQGENWYE